MLKYHMASQETQVCAFGEEAFSQAKTTIDERCPTFKVKCKNCPLVIIGRMTLDRKIGLKIFGLEKCQTQNPPN